MEATLVVDLRDISQKEGEAWVQERQAPADAQGLSGDNEENHRKPSKAIDNR